MPDTYITGLGVFLPNEPVDSSEMEDVLGLVQGRYSQVKDWVLDYNGIETRYYALDPNTRVPTHSNADLTALAIHALAAEASFDLGDLQCLACGTSSPDQFIPSHACMVHGLLGCPPCEVVATTGVCCSGMSALKYAWMSVRSGCHRNAVATGSELASISLRGRHFDPEVELKREPLEAEPMLAFENEFLRWMLSDGAGAVLITDTPPAAGIALRIDWIDLISFANEVETCMYSGGKKLPDGSLRSFRGIDDAEELIRDGYLSIAQDVRVLQSELPGLASRAFQAVMDRYRFDATKIDWLLPHYSSEGFREPLHDGLGQMGCAVPLERWFTNLKWKGNTGAASIYIMLEELVSSGRAKQGNQILCFVPESARFTFAFMHLTVM